MNHEFRAGSIGLIGLPNAGKSTLVNAVIGEKVAITSAKAQTTRRRVTGIYTGDDAQLIFVDAPGLIRANSGLNQFLQSEAEDVFLQADALLVVIGVDTEREEQVDELLEFAARTKKPWACVISKVDLEQVHRIPKIEEKVKSYGVPCWALSVQRNPAETRELLRKELAQLVPPAEGPLFDPECFTTQTVREMAAELIREQCFQNLQQEIPYGLAVRIIKFDERSSAMPRIHAELILSKETHKPIVIGEGGKRLKYIGTHARKGIENLMQAKVFLDLHVTVKPKWAKNAVFMREMGYVVPQ